MRQAEPSGLRRYVSVLEGIRPYTRDWLQTDIIAGITPLGISGLQPATPRWVAVAAVSGADRRSAKNADSR